MSFDGSFTHSMKEELTDLLQTGRISKINQPYPNELILTIRAHGEKSAASVIGQPNVCAGANTKVPYVNPSVPTNFTMIMRKHLSGGILVDVSQQENDRVLTLTFTARNELGDQTKLDLIVEIMARHSNIILVDQASGKIIDAIKHVGSDVNRYRLLLPGATYVKPPKQDLQNPFKMTDFDKIKKLITDFPNVDMLADNLRKTVQGLGNDTSLALANSLHKDENVEKNFQDFFKNFGSPKPTFSHVAGNKINFTAFPYPGTTKNQFFPTLSELLDAFYASKAQRDRVREQGSVLIQVVKNN